MSLLYTPKKHYDYIIVGAGAGGMKAAIGLKNNGKDVLLVGENIGGECTQTGCIPSKTFLSLAMHYVWKSHKQCNIELRQGIFDLIRKKVAEMAKYDRFLLDHAAVPFVQGKARFINKNTIEVATGKDKKKMKVTFNKCVISTGSHPQKIHIAGLPEDTILTNDNLFKLKELPSRIVIFGGGPIGIENGTAFAKFCTHTTIIVRSQMIPQEPPECVAVVKKSLIDEFEAHIYEYVKDTVYDKDTGHLMLKDKDGNEMAKVLKADYYLMALGRIPNTEGLDLEQAGVKYDKTGISVDHNLRTSNHHIYALGDVTNCPKFAHLAENQAEFIVERACHPWAQRVETPLPACTYSDPPIASTGDKEETELVKKFVIDFGKSARGKIEEAQGLIGCIYVDMISGRIQGASLVGHFAEHVINFFTLAVIKKMTVWDLEHIIVPYPTYFSGIDDLYDQFVVERRRKRLYYWGIWVGQHTWQIAAIFSFVGVLLFLIWGTLL